MSCEAALAAAFLVFASAGGAQPAPTPAVQYAEAAVSPLAAEPLFADIIGRAGALNGKVQAWKGQAIPAGEFASFKAEVATLAQLDMKGHLLLKERGTDGDLKCILRGISEDLPLKLGAVEAAADPAARDAALTDLGYLLRDNIEVITAPPAPPA